MKVGWNDHENCCIRAKLYGKEMSENDKMIEYKREKGVIKCIVRNKITFHDYLDCLFKGIEIKSNTKLFKAVKHNVFSISQTKIALSPHDDKRYLIKRTTKTLAWRHYSIMEET